MNFKILILSDTFSIDSPFLDLLSDRFERLRATDQGVIVRKLIQKLADLLLANSERKVIIFVSARAVAKHLAELLNDCNELFRAMAFTSYNRSTLEGGL